MRMYPDHLIIHKLELQMRKLRLRKWLIILPKTIESVSDRSLDSHPGFMATNDTSFQSMMVASG